MRGDDEPLLGEIGHRTSLEIVQVADVRGIAATRDVQLRRKDLDGTGAGKGAVVVKGVDHLPKIPGVGRPIVLRCEPTAIEQETDPVGQAELVERSDEIGGGPGGRIGLSRPIGDYQIDDVSAAACES